MTERPTTLILTGTTGNLGTYLLHEIAHHPSVERIYCLNRSRDADSRQHEALAARGLTLSNATATITHVTVDLTHPKLNIDETAYAELTSWTTVIIHSAWPVDFNRHFSSFRPALQGVRNLVSLALSCEPAPAHLFFLSSISAAGNWGALPGARFDVPEAELDDWKVARLGYGQSKLVAERLLVAAAADSGLSAAVCRIGQIAGPVLHGIDGQWPRQEWLPSLVASSRVIKSLPKTLGPMDTVDWVPVDRVAQIVTELALAVPERKSRPVEFYHVVNPRSVAWEALLPAVISVLGGDVQAVDFAEWVDKLEQSGHGDVDLKTNPAVKLLPFFKMLQDRAIHLPKARAVTLATKRTQQRSKTLAKLEPCTEEWMDLWMKQWQAST